MARVHTDFIALTEEDYYFFIQLLLRNKDSFIFEDVPLSQLKSFERDLIERGFHVIKCKYEE